VEKEKLGEEFKYSIKSHPLSKILYTLTLLAEVYASRLKLKPALALYDFISQAYSQLYGSPATILGSYILQTKAEAICRSVTERNKEPLEEAISLATQSVATIQQIDQLDASSNILLIQREQALADILKDKGENEQAE
jgi:hypothetical protein